MDYFTQILIGALGVVLSAMGTMILIYFKKISSGIDSMSLNMIEMNVKLERVITDQDWHRLEIKEIKEENKDIRNEIKKLTGV